MYNVHIWVYFYNLLNIIMYLHICKFAFKHFELLCVFSDYCNFYYQLADKANTVKELEKSRTLEKVLLYHLILEVRKIKSYATLSGFIIHMNKCTQNLYVDILIGY